MFVAPSWQPKLNKLTDTNNFMTSLPEGVARRVGLVNRGTGDVTIKLSKIARFYCRRLQIKRSGVIVYSYDSIAKEYFFYMGVHAASGDITDFGGGVRQNESVIVGGLRELEEESYGVFGPNIKPENIGDFYIATSNMVAIMFIRVDVDYSQISADFANKYKQDSNPELSGIVRLNRQEFVNAIFGTNTTYNMFSVVQDFMKTLFINNPSFIESL